MTTLTVADEQFSWLPDSAVPAGAFLKTVDTEDDTETVVASFTLEDDSDADMAATVTARSDDGRHFGIDVRAAYSRTGDTTYAVLRSPKAVNPLDVNPANWSARITRSGSAMQVLVKTNIAALDGVVVRWSAMGNVQAVKDQAFDIATVGLSLCLEDYAESPWNGSQGTTPDFVTGDAEPAVGTAVNGHAPALLEGAENLVINGLFADDVFDYDAFYIGTVFEIDTAATAAGVQAAPGLIGDGSGNFGLIFDSAGVAAYINDQGGAGQVAVTAACSTGERHFAECWYDGTHLHLALDGVEETPVAIDNQWLVEHLDVMVPQIGKGYSAYLEGKVFAVYGAQTALDATKRAGIRSRANARFGI